MYLGNDAYIDGNVGIGTSSPGAMLDIGGVDDPTFRISSIRDSGHYYEWKTSGTFAEYYDIKKDGTRLSLHGLTGHRFYISGSEKVTIDSNGKVGIGTTNPSKKLEVQGDVLFDGSSGANEFVYIDSDSAKNAGIIISEGGSNRWSMYNQGSNDYLIIRDEDASSNRVVIDSSGNVGIGTTNPGAPLQLGNGGSSTTSIYRSIISKGTYSTTAQRNQNLMTFQATTLANTNPFNDTTGESLKNWHFGIVSDNAYFNSPRFSFIRGGQERMVIDYDGKVGIGTTGPHELLEIRKATAGTSLMFNYDLSIPVADDVYGQILFRGGDTSGGVDNKGWGVRGKIAGVAEDDGGGLGLRFYTSPDRGASSADPYDDVSVERMRIDKNGNVGIGTTDPQGKLDVNGSAIFGTGGNLKINDLTTSTAIDFTTNAYINIDSDNNYNGNFLRIGTNGEGSDATNLMTILDSGKVGIGTTSPSEKLCIGNLSATEDVQNRVIIAGRGTSTNDEISSLIFSNSADTGSKTAEIIATRGSDNYGTALHFKTNQNNVDGGAQITAMTISENGNVGIGTISPNQKLEIIGPGYATADNSIRLGVSDDRYWDITMTKFVSATDKYDLYFKNYNRATPDLFIEGHTGNIGIGTTNPGAKLEVNGTDNKLRLKYDTSNYADISTNNAGNLVAKSTGGIYYFNTLDKNNRVLAYDFLSPGDTFTDIRGSQLSLKYNGTYKIKLNPNGDSYFNGGNVGIGTTLPQGKLHVGDQATNYFKVADDGEITLVGTARVKKQHWIGADALREPGAKPASFVAHGLKGAWEFADASSGNEEQISGTFKIPTDMDISVAPTFNIGWSAAGSSPGNSKWQLEYLWLAANEDTTAAAQETLTTISTASATSNGLVIATFSGIDLPTSSDKALFWRITRLSASGDDTISDDIHLHGIYICLLYTSPSPRDLSTSRMPSSS